MNNTIFFFFYNLAHQSVIFDKMIVFFAIYFPYILCLVVAVHLIFLRKSFREFIKVFLVSGITWAISGVLKVLIHAPRPPAVFSNVHSLFVESNGAFPSGHATFFAALALSLFFIDKKYGYWFTFFALLIGLARIIAGVHFPIDILGGFILGSLVAYLFKNV